MDGWIRAGLTGLVGLSACVAGAVPALAHGGRLPFDAWGGFTGDVLRCQRVIARAAAQCATNAWAARRACHETALAGGTCDQVATTARIAGARRAAQDAVDAACNEHQAISLQYLGSFDLQQDLIAFCRDWEHAAADRERDQALALAGWACHRFASRAIRERPRAVAERLRALHARRLG